MRHRTRAACWLTLMMTAACATPSTFDGAPPSCELKVVRGAVHFGCEGTRGRVLVVPSPLPVAVALYLEDEQSRIDDDRRVVSRPVRVDLEEAPYDEIIEVATQQPDAEPVSHVFLFAVRVHRERTRLVICGQMNAPVPSFEECLGVLDGLAEAARRRPDPAPARPVPPATEGIDRRTTTATTTQTSSVSPHQEPSDPSPEPKDPPAVEP